MFQPELQKFALFIIFRGIDHKAKQPSRPIISAYHPAKILRRRKYLLYLLAGLLVGGFRGLGSRVLRWLLLLLEEDLPSHLESLGKKRQVEIPINERLTPLDYSFILLGDKQKLQYDKCFQNDIKTNSATKRRRRKRKKKKKTTRALQKKYLSSDLCHRGIRASDPLLIQPSSQKKGCFSYL